jgi:hypothetical protein
MKQRKRQSWIKVFEEVHSFMELHLEKWNGIDEIRRTYDEFMNRLKKIRDLQPELQKDISGPKQELKRKRIRLLHLLMPAVNILEVYAQDHPVGKNTEALLINQMKLESLKNMQLLTYAKNLLGRCERYLQRSLTKESALDDISPMNDITRYGLTRRMLDEIDDATREFQSTFKLRQDLKTSRKKTRKKLEGHIRGNRKLLDNRLNKLMTVFSGTHPSFYEGYRAASLKNQKPA